MFVRDQKGISIIELMVVMLIISISLASALSNLDEVNRPLTNATFEITHFLRLARSQSVSQTKYISVKPISSFTLYAYSGDSCETATEQISDLVLHLPHDSSLITPEWNVCFSPRGLVAQNISFNVSDEHGYTKTIEIALGGGVRVQ